MTDEIVNIEIDGVPLEARKGDMVIAVADAAGIRIPRFCYHEKLTIAANCRMCLVEVERAPKPLPACATPVADGMKVFTRSPKAIDAQKGTMEFLLINHPLDCPICDQGGECELQDVSMGYGGDISRYSERKRVVKDKDIGPLVSTDMTRCIHCTRCVRFGQEIAGIMELGAWGRGENMRIGTFVERAVTSEMSGNVIDLCPVGALNAKPSRMSARGWELTQHATVAAHDCVGSNIYVHSLRGEAKRVVPRDNERINECWISDRDRFSYAGLNSEQRLHTPMIRDGEHWRECDWDTALEAVAEGLRSRSEAHGGEQLGVLVSANATLEEMALLRRLADALGCPNLDHRLRQWDFEDDDVAPSVPWLGQDIAELEHNDAVLLIGSDTRLEQPIVAHRLRKAVGAGAWVMCLNHRDFDFHFRVREKLIGGPQKTVNDLAAVLRAALQSTSAPIPPALADLMQDVEPSETAKAMADRLLAAKCGSILMGMQCLSHPYLSILRALSAALAQATETRLGYLPDGANAIGARLAGLVPRGFGVGGASADLGLNARTMMESPRKAYLLYGIEPEFDSADPQTALAALNTAEFVVGMTPFVTGAMRSYAHVLLPTVPFAETSGTFVNIQCDWQSFAEAVRPRGQARPGWKVLRVLGNALHVAGFDYVSSEDIRDELRHQIGEVKVDNSFSSSRKPVLPEAASGLTRISAVQAYRSDALVRRAEALQQTNVGVDQAMRINRVTAERLGLTGAEKVLVLQGNNQCTMPMIMDESIATDCVWVPTATDASAQLGPMFGPIELEAD